MFKPHSPVRVEFIPCVCEETAEVLCRPQRLPTELVIGPRRFKEGE